MRLVNFHAAREDVDVWKEQAHQQRMTFAAWLREACYAMVGGSVVPIPEDTYVPPPKPKKDPALKMAAELLERTKVKCEHRLPKGTYCKRCGRTH